MSDEKELIQHANSIYKSLVGMHSYEVSYVMTMVIVTCAKLNCTTPNGSELFIEEFILGIRHAMANSELINIPKGN